MRQRALSALLLRIASPESLLLLLLLLLVPMLGIPASASFGCVQALPVVLSSASDAGDCWSALPAT